MKRIFFLLVFALISVAGFSQDYFEGITGLKFLNTDSLVVDQDFIWKGDTIKKDSLVYVDIRTDSVGFRYINGQFKWIKNYSSQIAKFTIHIANDEDTVKTNELISELEFTDDTLKISEAGIVHKVRINSSTSVSLTAPTGLTVTGSPVTTSGTLALSFSTGYSLPTTASQTNWNTAYAWGNHAGLYRPVSWVPSWTDITSKPTFATVATSGSYTDLINKPTIPTNTNQLTNGAGFITGYTETDPTIYAWAKAATKPSYTYAEVGAQATLVSGTNIKTINGSSLLGAGDLTITGGAGTVTSVSLTAPTGLTVTGSPVTTSGTLALSFSTGYSLPTTASQTSWDAAYTDRLKWDGGSTGLNAATGRTSLGGTTIGQAMFTLANPSAISFPRFNADNTISALSAAAFRSAIGAGEGSVSSVEAYAPTGFQVSVINPTAAPMITLSYATGYSLPTTASQTNWTSAYNNMGKVLINGSSTYNTMNDVYFCSEYGMVRPNLGNVGYGGILPVSGGTIYDYLQSYALLNGSLSQDFSGRSFLLPNSINVNGNDGIARLVNGGHSFALFSNGDASVDGIFTASELYRGSSKELKHNIKPYKGNALDILNATKIYTYNLNSDNSFGVGFLAEDTHKWLSGENQKSHAMGNHLGLLTKAMQEQITLIEAMQEQISDLQTEIKKLKKRQLRRK